MKHSNSSPQNQSNGSKLAILLETVCNGSISKTAEQLNYTQPGLTYLLNTLEMDFGLQLLLRDHRGVSFTEEGKILEPYRGASQDRHDEQLCEILLA